MKDRAPTKPNRMRIVPEDGSPAFYATITRADDPTQAGDPLNKSTFLRDETASLFGMGNDAVPNDVFAFLGSHNLHWWKTTDESGNENYLQSANRNEYPDFGLQNGLTYVYLGVPFQNSVDAKNTAVGSYVGTGKYGSANRNSITFSFVPKFLIVVPNNRVIGSGMNINIDSFEMVWIEGLSEETLGRNAIDGTVYKRFFTLNNNELRWYAEKNADSQMNTSGTTYRYFAVG